MSECNYNGLSDLVKKRRSIRWFKPDPLPDDYIDKIIEVARWAPSGFHTQPWEFVVVKKKELKDKIADIIRRPSQTAGQEYFRNAPVLIILLGDWRAKVGLPGNAEEQERRVDNLFCSSLASAFLYMHLAATTLGLASAWVSAASSADSQRKIKELLRIPEQLRIYDMMAVGYGSHSPIPKTIRNKEDIVHYDDSGHYRTDAQVKADAEKTRAWCISAH
jgi:nitroreductase